MSFPLLRAIATRPLLAIIGRLSLLLALSARSAIKPGDDTAIELSAAP